MPSSRHLAKVSSALANVCDCDRVIIHRHTSHCDHGIAVLVGGQREKMRKEVGGTPEAISKTLRIVAEVGVSAEGAGACISRFEAASAQEAMNECRAWWSGGWAMVPKGECHQRQELGECWSICETRVLRQRYNIYVLARKHPVGLYRVEGREMAVTSRAGPNSVARLVWGYGAERATLAGRVDRTSRNGSRRDIVELE